MKIPDEYCRFLVKWKDDYLGPPAETVRSEMVPKRQCRLYPPALTFENRTEADVAAYGFRERVRAQLDAEPRLRIVRLIPGPKRRAIIAAKRYVGIYEATNPPTDVATRAVQRCAAYEELRDAIRILIGAKG